jgi:uncharacterized tellurite resistance protein B-like protein
LYQEPQFNYRTKQAKITTRVDLLNTLCDVLQFPAVSKGYQKSIKAFFVFGFFKSDLGNIRDDECEQFRNAAKSILALSGEQIRQLIQNGQFKEVKNNG